MLRIQTAENFFDRLIGLMGTKEFPSNKYEALFFPATTAIHTFFMRYPIDIIFLDENNKIVDIREEVKPFRVVFAKGKAVSALEMDAGAAKINGLKKGDILQIEEKDRRG